MDLSFFYPLLILLVVYLATMVAIVQIKQDTSIANFVWGGGCLLVALYTFFMGNMYLVRHVILTTLIVFWAGRLILYVYLRYHGTDPRFQSWKQKGGYALLINIGYIFGLQALLMVIMSAPIVLINISTNLGLTSLDYVGIVLWLIGYYFEAVSDYQLFTFTRNPANKGKVMRYGLWRYSRHPNYFGEVTMWWGLFLIALSVDNGIYAIVAPATITFLLLFVTGIPWVEEAMKNNPEYQDYKQHTSIFIPWFSK